MKHRMSFCAILLTLGASPTLAASAAGPPGTQDADRAAALAAAGLSFTGNWYATEVIVFERPQVDAAGYSERLLVAGLRSYPARIRSLDPAGAGAAVRYSPGPDDPACRQVAPGAPPAESGVPEAFARPAEPAASAAPESAETPGDEADAAAPVADALLPPPDPLEELRKALRVYEDTLVDQSLVWLPAASRTLAREAQRLAGSGRFRVLFHETWVQDLAAREAPAAILVQAGSRDAGVAELEGTLQFGRNGSTRFETDLWFRPPGAAASATEYVELRDTLRLGDGELHYLDHPKLGVLVRTTPVALPAELVAAFEALNPPAAGTPAADAPPGPPPPR